MTAPRQRSPKLIANLFCGKLRYASPVAARAGAIARGLTPMYAYRCRVCGGWHLTRLKRGGKDKVRL